MELRKKKSKKLDLETGKLTEKIKRKLKKPKPRANDLDGTSWMKWSISIWSDILWTVEETRLRRSGEDHPANFPYYLPHRLIQCYLSGENKVVLDPFVGIGTTLFAAMRLGHRSIGFDPRQDYRKITQNRIQYYKSEDKEYPDVNYIQHTADRILDFVDPESVDLLITSPPYWNVLQQERTADKREVRDYADYQDVVNDLCVIKDYSFFLLRLSSIFAKCFKVLKPGAYCIVNCQDIRHKGKLILFHADIARRMEKIGFNTEDIVIWDRRLFYNSLSPLGFPYKFVIQKTHEYLLVFRKPER